MTRVSERGEMGCVCVGVCGGTCAGKNELVKRLARAFSRLRPSILLQDNYYLDRSGLTLEERARLNYDEPSALDLEALAADIAQLKSGREVAAPAYDFSVHARKHGSVVRPSRLLIVDGTLILHDSRVRDLLDVKVFVAADNETRLDRRMQRDTRERGRSPESVREQWAATVRPMHDLYVEPEAAWADVTVCGDDIYSLDLTGLVDLIESKLQTTRREGIRNNGVDRLMGMAELVRERFSESIEVKQKASGKLSHEIATVVAEMVCCLRDGGKVIFCGNGGSAADAQHLAAELVGRFQMERDALPAMALNVNTSSITAIGNDYSYDEVFARQARAFVRDGDVFVGISTSGNSRSIVNAVQVAKDAGAYTVGMTGEGGGELAKVAHLTLKVPSGCTARIQETHITIGHIICELVESEIFAQPAAIAK